MNTSLNHFIEAARHAMRNAGLEQKDVAVRLNVTPQHLNAVLNGRANLSRKLEDSLCKLLQVQPLGWWMTAGQPDKDMPQEHDVTTKILAVREETHYVPIPLRGGLRTHMAFRQDWLACRATTPRKLFLARMEGDAMRPEIADGALVLVDGGQCEPTHARVFFLRIDGVTCFRRLDVEQGRVLAVRGDNGEAHPLGNGETVEILGRALWQCADL